MQEFEKRNELRKEKYLAKASNVLHTFSVCAYKESPYLENCVLSLLKQTVKSEIIICTSTPNEFINKIADNYDLPIFMNSVQNGLSADFNFAFNSATSAFVTLAHQDDIYKEEYANTVLKAIRNAKKEEIIILYCEQSELRNGKEVSNNAVSKIKKIMNTPLRIKFFQCSAFIRRCVLSLGCSICCPSVTFNKNRVSNSPFSIDYIYCTDWYLWTRLTKMKGRFVYLPERLILHRVHPESCSSEGIENKRRYQEELSMFCIYWPTLIAKCLLRFYSKASKSNET